MKGANIMTYTMLTVHKNKSTGGIQGGISNGMDIYFTVAFKPVATIMKARISIIKET
jgi:chorismate synthase